MQTQPDSYSWVPQYADLGEIVALQAAPARDVLSDVWRSWSQLGLAIVVERNRGARYDERFSRTFGGAGRSWTWPRRIALVPEGGDASSRYRIVASALDATGAPVGTVRAISGYVEGRVVVLRLVLEDACRRAMCSDALTCRAGGCVDSTVDPTTLPPLSSDAGVERSDGGDAGGHVGDAGDSSLAVSDSGDANSPSDAGDSAPPPVGDGGVKSCRADSVMAEEAFVPIDMIWVVDSSGGMENEARAVQDNLNAFSTAMDMVDLDYHVVMITTSSFVTVPPPLGGGPRYRFIDRGVDSHESLQALLDEFPRYSDFLRRAATTHIVVTTDDESELDPDVFLEQMHTLLEKSFVFHAIASERVAPGFTNPTGACVSSVGSPPEGAANPGDRYYQLARETGGLTFSICTADWSRLFADLTTVVAVPTPLPCGYEIPPPPSGMSFDHTRVNVVYTPSDGAADTIPSVGTPDRCGAEGWYYDDPANPSVVQLCPSSCTLVGGDSGGRIDLAYGCATQLT